MPDGVLQWLDADTGEGRIMGGGRRYAVRVADVDAAARYPGARVHFDVDHTADGDVATAVVLRRGTRVAPKQRRFGDLVGARTKETKADEHRAEIDIGRDRVRHPMRIAAWWAEHMAAGHVDDAVRLYSPTAVLHVEGDVAVGPDAIRAELVSSPVYSRGLEPTEIVGEGDAIRVSWPGIDGASDPLESHLVVEHGEIVEQWQGEVRIIVDVTTDVGPTELSVEGDVSAAMRGYALDKVARVTGAVSEPLRHVSIRLEWLADPGRERRARARATVDIDGDPVRASVSGSTMNEAIDLLEDRLAERIRHRASHRRALRRRGTASSPGEWRHGDRPEPAARPRPAEPEERAVVRRPTWSAEPCTLDEAVFDLESLDLEFLLFTDLASGLDAVVHRRGDGTYGLRTTQSASTSEVVSIAAVQVDQRPTPRISVDEAREHLDNQGEGWVFFEEAVSGRGHVLYRREDGHDGLITPRLEARSKAMA